jgi:hypothetical protein
VPPRQKNGDPSGETSKDRTRPAGLVSNIHHDEPPAPPIAPGAERTENTAMKLSSKIGVRIINIFVFVAILGAVELYYRVWGQEQGPEFANTGGLWQTFRPYVMFSAAPGEYKRFRNEFTNQWVPSSIKTNSLGFNDRREFSLTKPYQKVPNEKVVLFTGGSVAWGVGASATQNAIAGRMEYWLNKEQGEYKYSVINLAMGGWIAFQEFIGLQMWGTRYDPDWVVVMDGFNDAGVGCAYSQGPGNPLYFSTMNSYVNGYLMSTTKPVFYRGWLENEIIKYSAAYRNLTGKRYVPSSQIVDETSHETELYRKQIIPTKVGEARAMLDFYLESQRGMLKMFPRANFVLSTQPIANQIAADFTNIYDDPPGSDPRFAATAKREAEVEQYLTQYQDQWCSQETRHPAYVYVLVNGAIRLQRLVQDEAKRGRNVQYANIGLLFPKERPDRLPLFIDSAHMNDEGYDLVGHYYAEKILGRPVEKSAD